MKTTAKKTVTKTQLRDMELSCLSQVVAILGANGFTCNIHNGNGKRLLADNTTEYSDLYKAAKSTGHDWVTFHRGDAIECEGGVHIDWDSQGPTITDVDAADDLCDTLEDRMFEIGENVAQRWQVLNCR